jgi:hypothetical protein
VLTKSYLYSPGAQVPVGNILPTDSIAVNSPTENFLPWLLLLVLIVTAVAAVFGATHATGAAVATTRVLWL